MNIKSFFSASLTVLGTVALIYAAILFVNTESEVHNIKVLVIYGILGLIFFIAGIGLIRTTKDKS